MKTDRKKLSYVIIAKVKSHSDPKAFQVMSSHVLILA